jgi:hypothetical protein
MSVYGFYNSRLQVMGPPVERRTVAITGFADKEFEE